MIRIGILLFLLFPVGLFAQTAPCTEATFSGAFLQVAHNGNTRISSDFRNLYNKDNAKNWGVALMGTGILANTEMDANFQRWHGRHIRSSFTNDLSWFSKQFGEGQVFMPVMATSAITYRVLQEKQGLPEHTLGEFACRTTRGYLVGAPALLVFQSLLGAGRPRNTELYRPSQWRPFRNDNAVSGHAYVGAVPFITAAQMTDRPGVKGLFYTLSTFTAWSRVNDDAHFLSQAILGWYLAYLSVRSVSQTEESGRLPRGLTIFPTSYDDSVGVGVLYRY